MRVYEGLREKQYAFFNGKVRLYRRKKEMGAIKFFLKGKFHKESVRLIFGRMWHIRLPFFYTAASDVNVEIGGNNTYLIFEKPKRKRK